ncbi:hypothetical protein DPEC_G00012530 [Dallia pectoralis]|uniref:Uncharacterized protein n=1 Tax=Dallia pectoralis TaxID=75939 RepID=A0ACC2HM14_DALPE|nr:hypothetical protein DPEC_G00012530 [Dallia pectoralis]
MRSSDISWRFLSRPFVTVSSPLIIQSLDFFRGYAMHKSPRSHTHSVAPRRSTHSKQGRQESHRRRLECAADVPAQNISYMTLPR